MRPACSRRSTVHFFYLSHGLVRVCEVKLSHMGKINRNPDLVCDRFRTNSLHVVFFILLLLSADFFQK